MSDASLLWGGDLAPSSTGDVAMVSADALGQQRLLRRLLTNPGDYIWHPDYGAGLAQFIGEPCDVSGIRARIRSQIFLEATVAHVPEPTIDVESSIDGGVYVRILYVDVATDTSQALSFSVSI